MFNLQLQELCPIMLNLEVSYNTRYAKPIPPKHHIKDFLNKQTKSHFNSSCNFPIWIYIIIFMKKNLPINTKSCKLSISLSFCTSLHSLTRLLDICNTFSLRMLRIPFILSMKLYDIHNSSKVSANGSSPTKVFILFRPSDNIFKFFKAERPFIFSIKFVLSDNFLRPI